MAPLSLSALAARLADSYETLPESAGLPWQEEILVTDALHARLPIRPVYTTVDPYATAEALAAGWAAGEFRVFSEYCDHPVFTVDENLRGRAVHDWYWHGNGSGRKAADFGLAGEIAAWRYQAARYPRWTWPVLAGEIIAQTAVFEVTGAFPAQRALALPDEWIHQLLTWLARPAA